MKTKFLISTIILSSFIFSAFAQNEKKYKWGLSLAINDAHSQIAYLGLTRLAIDAEGNMISGGEKTNKSFSLSIAPKYFINDDWLIRFEYGMAKIDLKNYSTSVGFGAAATTSRTIGYDTVKQTINRFVLGIQWNFFSNKKIESYGGLTLPYIKYGDITRNSYSEGRNIATDTLISWNRSHTNVPGGYAFGLGVFAGFNVYVIKHLSFGAEFSSALLHYNVGGESSAEASYQSMTKPLPPITTGGFTNPESYKGIRFAKIFSSFNITFWI